MISQDEKLAGLMDEVPQALLDLSKVINKVEPHERNRYNDILKQVNLTSNKSDLIKLQAQVKRMIKNEQSRNS